MKAFGTLLGIIVGLALLTALLVSGYFLFNYIANVFGTLDTQVGTMTAIASVVALLCATIIAGGFRAHSSSESTASQKVNVYERLVLLCADRLKTGTKERMEEGELIKLEQLLSLHGSHKVISAYMHLRKTMQGGGQAGDESLSHFNKLVLAMRADLGRNDFNIKDMDILDLLV